MQVIGEAYQVLSDDNLRSHYDTQGKASVEGEYVHCTHE